MHNWKETTLEEVIYPVSETFDFTGKGVVHFLNTGDILDGKLLHNDFVKVETLPGQAKKSFLLGDILYSEIRPANKRYMLVDFDSSNSVASTKLMVLRTKDGVDKQFIYQILTSQDTLKEFQFIAESRSGTFPQITFEAISFFPILLPPLPEQRAIAAILSSFDNKIELLRRQNKTLEQIARTIFKEWFVNFTVNGEKLKVNSKTGLPEGWRWGRLGEELRIAYGKNLPTTELIPNGFPVFGGNGQIGFYSEFLYEDRQVLISCRGEASGKVNISLPKSFVTNNSLILEIPEGSTVNYCFLKYFSLNTDFTNYVSGSAQPQITIEGIKDCPLLLPPKMILDELGKLIEPAEDKTLFNSHQIETLSQLRDLLLPKLMKGEIRVKL